MKKSLILFIVPIFVVGIFLGKNLFGKNTPTQTQNSYPSSFCINNYASSLLAKAKLEEWNLSYEGKDQLGNRLFHLATKKGDIKKQTATPNTISKETAIQNAKNFVLENVNIFGITNENQLLIDEENTYFVSQPSWWRISFLFNSIKNIKPYGGFSVELTGNGKPWRFSFNYINLMFQNPYLVPPLNPKISANDSILKNKELKDQILIKTGLEIIPIRNNGENAVFPGTLLKIPNYSSKTNCVEFRLVWKIEFKCAMAWIDAIDGKTLFLNSNTCIFK